MVVHTCNSSTWSKGRRIRKLKVIFSYIQVQASLGHMRLSQKKDRNISLYAKEGSV